MDTYIKLAIFVAVAYLIGNISPATILGKLYGVDIKKAGSGNAGTTNVLRVLGWKAALCTLAIDVTKGLVAVNLGSHNCGTLGAQLCFIAVVYGHIFPVFYKFKGGKGVATSFGAALAVDWPSAFAALAITALAAGSSRKMSIGSIAAAISYPLLILYYYPDFFPVAVIMGLTIIFTHRSNIKRLKNGEEAELSLGAPQGIDKNAVAATVAAVPATVAENAANAGTVVTEAPEAEPVDFYANEKKPKIKTEDKKKIAVIGNGSFGTALANLLAHNGHHVMIWGRNREAIDDMKESKQNRKYLPGVILSDKIRYTLNMKTAASGRDIVVFAVPAQHFAEMAKKAARYVSKDTVIVNLAKGIEQGSLKRMSEIAKKTFPKNKYVALSGPSHAEEISRNYPATVVVASEDKKAAEMIQNTFMNGKFRVYTSDDVTGVEIGGALKNVIAIGTGISDGMGFGDNAKAAITTRGIHEITRLGVKLGAQRETFAGLSGIGDLMVTCTSDLSRNRRCGILIGKGYEPAEAVEKIGSTVEGFYTVEAAKTLAEKNDIDMPITDAVDAVINGEIHADEAVGLLMQRDKKDETV